MDIKRICDIIDKRQNELYDILCSLIKINSENFGDKGCEEECAKYIKELFENLGLETEMYSPVEVEGLLDSPDYFPGRDLENRYNVTARWCGKSDEDNLMLMGHIDTVPVGDEGNWNFSPLDAKLEDGKIWGRGACDDKYAIASALFIIKLLKDEGFVPRENLLFSAYCDEELGGSHGALATVLKYPTKSLVNLDGREKQIWNCASGGQVVYYRYHVNETVDSAERTAKAFPIVMEEIAKFGQRRRAELEANRFYAGTIVPGTSLRYNEIRAGNNDMDKGVGVLQFTFYTERTREEIEAEFKELERVLSEKLAPLGITGDGITPYTRFFHYGYCEPDTDDIKLLLEASEEAVGFKPIVCGSCLSDLSILYKYGPKSSVAFGAGYDFSRKGGPHQPNEHIDCKDLLAYTKTVAAYVIKKLG